MKGYLKLMDKHHFSFYAFIWLTYWRPLFSLVSLHTFHFKAFPLHKKAGLRKKSSWSGKTHKKIGFKKYLKCFQSKGESYTQRMA